MSKPAFLNTDYGSLGPVYGLTKICGADAPTFKTMLPAAISESNKCSTAYLEAEKDWSDLRQSFTDLTCRLADAQLNLQGELSRTWDEVIRNPVASDTRGLAGLLLPAEREAALITDALNLVRHLLIPAAFLRKLEAAVKLRQAEALEAGLHAAFDEATTLERMNNAGVQKGLFIGDMTQRLKFSASEATRQAQQALAELDAERERQAILLRQRIADGQLTRAEAVHASLELSRNTTQGKDNA